MGASGRGPGLAAQAAAEAEAWALRLEAGQVAEHATYVVDVRRARRARMTWLTLAVVSALLLAGPLWGSLTSAARAGGWAADGAQPADALDGPSPLEAGDPRPQEPSGTGDVEHLDPRVRRAVERAQAAAAADGVDLVVHSGWRSRAHQERLYDAAVEKYGSRAKARRWVLPPDESAHVRGEAVDVGPRPAAAWLDEHGVRFGLCRRYANEPWHFELLAPAKGQPCPAMEPHA